MKAGGIDTFLISRDIHDVFDLADRVCVTKNGHVAGIGLAITAPGKNNKLTHSG